MAGHGNNADIDQAMVAHVRSLHARWHCRSTPKPCIIPPPLIPIASSSRRPFKNNISHSILGTLHHSSNQVRFNSTNQTSSLFQHSHHHIFQHFNRPTFHHANNSNFQHSDNTSLEQSSDVPWTCEPSPPRETADWGSWTDIHDGVPAVPVRVLTDKEKAVAVAKKAQWAALQACVSFFKNAFSESEDSDDEMDEEDGYQSKVLDFMLDVFEKDVELRGYYEKNWESGYFSCLVCGVSGVKVGKLYSNCIGLVQHAKDISKTMKPRAHRALANAVCRVLRWDIKQLPSVVLDAAKPFSTTFGESSQQKEDVACDEDRNISRDIVDVLDIGRGGNQNHEEVDWAQIDPGDEEEDANATDNDEVDWDQIDSGDDEVEANVNTNANVNDSEVDWDQMNSGDDDDNGSCGGGGSESGAGDDSDEIDWDNL